MDQFEPRVKWLAAAAAIAASLSQTLAQCPGRWLTEIGNPGVNGAVLAILPLPLELGGGIVVGGRFTSAGGIPASNIARYEFETNSWSALGAGVTGGTNPGVFALGLLRGPRGAAVVAGGLFTTAGETPAFHLARFNLSTSEWSAMGLTEETVGQVRVNSIRSLSDTELLVSGFFSTGGTPTNGRVSRYNDLDQSWTAFPGTAMRPVLTIATHPSGDIIAGGSFGSIGSSGFTRIARYCTSTGSWSALGTGLNNWVYSVVTTPLGEIYAGGILWTAGEDPASGIAKFNPDSDSWLRVGGGISGSVATMLVLDDGRIVAGGNMSTADDRTVNNIAVYDPGSNKWSPLGADPPGVAGNSAYPVGALAQLPDGDVVIGGDFSFAGRQQARSIVRYSFRGGPITCIADIDCSGRVNIEDVFRAVDLVLSGDIAGDLNGDRAVGVQDLFDFLQAYFAGGC